MLRDNLLRTIARSFLRSTRSVSPASCILLAGLSLLVFAFLPGYPYRLDQYDLPKDVALGAFGAVSALYLLSSHSTVREDRVGFTLAAFLGWVLLAAPFVGENHVLAWRTVGLFAAAPSVFLLARRVGTRGGSNEVFTGITLIIGLMCALVLLETYGGMPFFSAPRSAFRRDTRKSQPGGATRVYGAPAPVDSLGRQQRRGDSVCRASGPIRSGGRDRVVPVARGVVGGVRTSGSAPGGHTLACACWHIPPLA